MFKVLATLALAATGATAQRPTEPIRQLNTTAFLGRWFQIANVPQPYEVFCPACTNANYGLNSDGTVSVVNRANFAEVNGVPCDIEGYAIQDAQIDGQLTVVFFDTVPATPNYQVVRLGPTDKDGKYSWAITTDPARSSLYILNRFPLMDSLVYDDIVAWLRANDYNPSRLIATPQIGCNYERDNLEL